MSKDDHDIEVVGLPRGPGDPDFYGYPKSLEQQKQRGAIQVIHEFDDKPVVRDYEIDFERSHLGDDDDPLTTIVIKKDNFVDIEY